MYEDIYHHTGSFIRLPFRGVAAAGIAAVSFQTEPGWKQQSANCNAQVELNDLMTWWLDDLILIFSALYQGSNELQLQSPDTCLPRWVIEFNHNSRVP